MNFSIDFLKIKGQWSDWLGSAHSKYFFPRYYYTANISIQWHIFTTSLVLDFLLDFFLHIYVRIYILNHTVKKQAFALLICVGKNNGVSFLEMERKKTSVARNQYSRWTIPVDHIKERNSKQKNHTIGKLLWIYYTYVLYTVWTWRYPRMWRTSFFLSTLQRFEYSLNYLAAGSTCLTKV